MSNPTWDEVERAMADALELAEEEQPAYLARQRPEIRAEVESLLAASRCSSGFLEGGPGARDPGRLLGRRIGPYKLLEEIGRGGMGAVYRAERDDGRFSKQVAVKLAPAAVDSPEMMRRFTAEQQILATLEHPHITRLLDAGISSEGLPYIVMEQVDGVPVDEYCRARTLPEADRLRLFRDICSAVHYAHQHLVVHRDLKPANILVTAEGTPKLLDFGVAKMLGVLCDGPRGQTRTAWNPMTPDYASPEQLRGAGITTASDIYSLGVLLYQLLTGERPYEITGKSIEDAMRAVEGPPPKLGGRAQHPADLDAIIAKAMRAEPQERYASAEELSADIGRHVAGLPVLAHRGSFRYVARKFVGRHRFGVATAMLLVLLVVAGVAGIIRQSRIAERERARAQRRFGDVRQLANYVLFDLNGEISVVPGTTALRKRMVTRALGYLDSLARESDGDASLQVEMAAGYARIGDVQGGLGLPNLGDTAGALASYGKANQILRQILARDPALQDAQRSLARLLLSMGGARQPLRNGDEAVANVREALAMLEMWSARAPGVAELMDLMGDAHARLGDLGIDQRAERLKSLEMYQAVFDAHPSNERLARVADVHRALGAEMEAEGDVVNSIEHLRKAREIDEQRVAANALDRSAKMVLSFDYGYLGRWHSHQGNLAEALANDRRAVEIRRGLSEADPQDAAMRRLLAFGYLRLGQVLSRMGEPGAAVDNYHRVTHISEDLVKANPADPASRDYLVQGSAGEGLAEADLARRAGGAQGRSEHRRRACSSYRRALDSYAEHAKTGGTSSEERELIGRAAKDAASCPFGK